MINTLEKFLARTIRDSNGCLLWQGALDKAGYGRTCWKGQQGITAHRAVWLASGLDIPEGTELNHICHVRACVNIEHLETVSHQENMRKTIRPFQDPYCLSGHLKTYTSSGVYICKVCRYRGVEDWRARNPEQVKIWGRASKTRCRARQALVYSPHVQIGLRCL